MDIFVTIAAFVLAIVILVSLHELGHFLVARLMGVKVLRFSIGFGKPLWQIRRGDTDWCIAPIPLGGYVKMVDTREGPVVDADLPYAFDRQHPFKRMLIVLAGPLTNLLLACLLYTMSFSLGGITTIRPWVGMVTAPSVAAMAGFQAGDRIESVNGKAVSDWSDAQTNIMLNLDAGEVRVRVRTVDGAEKERIINAAGTPLAADVVRTNYLGMLPYRVTRTVSVVEADSAAARAGLKKGDVLLSVDGQLLQDWPQWVQIVQKSAGQNLHVTYLRGGKVLHTNIRPDSVSENGAIIGRVGMGVLQDDAWRKTVELHTYPPFGNAVVLAVKRVGHYVDLTMGFFGKLLTGKASWGHISGPLTIADVAGKAAAVGWQSYVEFLALVSVSLGILNLLPIPVLDGGHLLYYAAEWLRGRPLGPGIQEWGVRLGLVAMLLLMLVAFFNDITRLFG